MGKVAIIILMGVRPMAFLASVVYIATNEEDELPEVNAGARSTPPSSGSLREGSADPV